VSDGNSEEAMSVSGPHHAADIVTSAERLQVSVIIVSWNVVDEVLACLSALVDASKGVSLDITVVDNASHDGTADAVGRAFRHVRVIANHENVGFARACNQGIRQTRGPYVLLINPDCLIAADACQRMVAYLTSHPQVGVVGPRVRRADGSDDLRSPRRLPTLWSDLCDRSRLAEFFPRSRLFAWHHLPAWDRSTSGEVEGLSGACLMLSRRALDAVGLLDEGFFLFGEDADLCLRLRRAGWQVHYTGSAVVVHQGGASMRQVSDRVALWALASRQRFFRKHRSRLYALMHRVLNAFLAIAKMTLLAPLAIASTKHRHKIWLQWRLLRWCCRGSNVDEMGAPVEDVLP
jgi:N-acetylglucosaminyl-diphospho-decaprenol L-rhamnosyltransferase